MPVPSFIGYVQHRREPLGGPSVTAAERNVRVPVQVYPHEAPDPIRQGDTPSRWAKVPVVTFQNIAYILAQQKDNWGEDMLWAPDHTAAVNYSVPYNSGYISRWRERSNIAKDQAVAYGSMFELSADEKYDLLMGR